MGLFRRKKEQAIPKPGTPEFDEAVEGTALPDDQSVSMGESGWTEPGPKSEQPDRPTADERTDEGEQAADQPKPKRAGLIIRGMARGVPNQGGFGAGIPGPKKRPKDE